MKSPRLRLEISLSNLLLLATVVCAIISSCGSHKVEHQPHCMHLFYQNETAFDVCKDHPCLLFKDVKPYIYISPNHTHLPFKCNERHQFADRPDGPFFNFISEIPSLKDAHCIYCGPECTYNDQVNFLTKSHETGKGYQFIVGGLMFIMPHRINNVSIPSTPFTNGKILVVGPLATRDLSLGNAFSAVFGPFDPLAWKFVIVLISIFIIIRLAISLSFTVPFRWSSWWWNVLGEYKTTAKLPHQFENVDCDEEMSERIHTRLDLLVFYNKYWSYSAKTFIFLIVLFYELALFNHVFELMTRPPTRHVQDLSENELKSFALLNGSGQEYIFRLSADPNDVYKNNPNPPWEELPTMDKVYERLMNSSNTYSISYERALMYQMTTRGACDKLTVYETNAKTSFYHGGWYYSVDVPHQVRTETDKTISELVITGVADRALGHQDTSTIDTCGRGQHRINFLILLLPLFPISISIMIAIFIRILIDIVQRICIGRIRRKRYSQSSTSSGSRTLDCV